MMDPRIIEAFYRCLVESVKDSDMPMEPSDFQKDHLNLYTSAEFKLDLRLSSFKRVSKHFNSITEPIIFEYVLIKTTI